MIKNYVVAALIENADNSVRVTLKTVDASATTTIVLPAGDPLIAVLTIGRAITGTYAA